MSTLVNIAAGAVILLVGRKLFWLFVAIVGFYVGVQVARSFLAGEPVWLVWLIASSAGIIGAIVAMLFQRVAFALAGFYAGGYLAMAVAERFFHGTVGTIALLVGGVIGAVVAALVMDWAIVVLSCLVGAALVVESLGLVNSAALVGYVALLAIGISVQAQLMRRTTRPAAPDN
jgi:uncharacterized protein DUF4203